MKIQFILKLYSLLALSLGLFIFFTCGEQAFIASAIALMGGAFAILTFTQPSARYMQEGGEYVAYMEKDGHDYRVSKDGAFVSLNGQWLVSNRCPSAKVANKVRSLNGKSQKWSGYVLPALLLMAFIAYSPAMFPSVLGTPSAVSYLSNMSTLFNATLICLAIFSVFAFVLRQLGGIKATLFTGPFSVELEVPELPEIAPANADFAVIATVHGEKPADYLKRVNEAKDKTALLVIAPKHAPVWMVETPTETAAIDRTKGSEQFGVDPVPFPQIENENEYRRGLASVFSGALAYFGTNNRIAERVAASHDPLMEVVKQTAFCFALLFSVPSFAQNNSAQALDYLGANYEKAKPSGVVAFHYAKLSVKVQGNAQKTFADLLTHSTGFDDAGKWGALQVVTVDGMAIARQAKAAPVATKDEKPKGESARPLTQKSADAMGSMKTYFSTAETERRISEREIAADRFSREYGENIRKEVTSILWIGFGWMFFALLLIGLVFWAAAKIAANESAIFSNGIPIFGTIQNWVHGWSAGVLFVIVLFYVVVYIIYSTLAWIFPIQSPFISIPLTIANAAAAVSIGHRIIPNKRVRGGQNFSGGNAPGQRQLGA